MPKPRLKLLTTTLWEYPSQNFGGDPQGDTGYIGATPSYILWNLLQRYTRPGDLVVDPMAGSGTTLDVARSLGRRALAYDIEPPRKEVLRSDARRLPLEDQKADFVFVDPPYSDHIRYSGRPECIGELSAETDAYYDEMRKVIAEMDRVLRPDRYLALYVSDSVKKGKPMMPIGLRLFGMLSERFVPVDVVCVTRHNATLKRNHWHTAAVEGNYFLRGFNYLFVLYKGVPGRPVRLPDRRDPAEIQEQLAAFQVERGPEPSEPTGGRPPPPAARPPERWKPAGPGPRRGPPRG